MTKIESWFRAFRLRTLPLSFSSVILGSLLALWRDSFDLWILIGALTTTLFLQVLSNLANDYGDFKSGVDNDNRLGPRRSLQKGEITPREMLTGIIICGVLAFISGVGLLYEASKRMKNEHLLIFFVIGVLAIAAAVKYTVGKKPYGYRGLGDIAVFLFFGIAGVAGTYFLHTQKFTSAEILPAVSIGLLATGVLNLNNMRDYENDKASGKNSLVVYMGLQKARIYHTILVLGALAAAIVFTLVRFQSGYQFLFLIAAPMLIQNVLTVIRSNRSGDFDAELKKLAIATLVFAVTLGIGLNY